MKKFTSIEQFRNVVATVNRATEFNERKPKISFQGTVKLHGTNAGLRRNLSDSGDITYICQSRNNVVGSGHYGFPQTISEIPREELEKLFAPWAHYHQVTLYGEWIGPGVQKLVAINKLPTKQWVLFAVAVGDKYVDLPDDVHLHEYNIFNVKEVDTFEVTVDFNDPSLSLPIFEEHTLKIDALCPWGKKFDIEGVGEGIVWRPVNLEQAKTFDIEEHRLWFKTKGGSHSKTKVRKVASTNPETLSKIKELVETLMTERRLEQGIEYLREMCLPIEMRFTKEYLMYVGRELKREELDTVEASDMKWSKFWKACSVKARQYFFQAVDREAGL